MSEFVCLCWYADSNPYGAARICAIFAGQVKSDEIAIYMTVDMKEIIFDS